MSSYNLYGMKKLCYTEVTDFTEFEGIGRDPMYKRFDSVYSIVEEYIEPEYRDFLAHPQYNTDEDQIWWYVREWVEIPRLYNKLSEAEKENYTRIKDNTIAVYKKVLKKMPLEDKHILTAALRFIDDDFIYCYDNKVVLIAWGMRPVSSKHIIKGFVVHEGDQNSHKLYFKAGEHGNLADKLLFVITRPEGSILSYIDLPKVVANDGYVFGGWEPNPVGVKVNKSMTFRALYEELPVEKVELVNVNFVADEGGCLEGETNLTIAKGASLDPTQIPGVTPKSGYVFDGWDTSIGSPIHSDIVVRAKFRREAVRCRFIAGDNGLIEGNDNITLPCGTMLLNSDIPTPKAKKGYKFVGWDHSPINYVLSSDTTFTAQYEKESPWYAFINKGCLMKLLWLLLALLLLFLLFWLLKDASCSCSRDDASKSTETENEVEEPAAGDSISSDPYHPDNPRGIYNPDDPYTIPPTDSTYQEVLPPNQGVLPPIDDDDIQPDNPYIVSNRLNILLENTDKHVGELARKFKQCYPSDEYQVIYHDDVVKRIQVTVPPQKREELKEEIPAKLAPEFEVFVFDESLFELTYIPNDPIMSDPDKAWYLDAINAPEAWDVSLGSEEVVVAIVDNGFNITHPELSSKVYKPYNVWKHNNDVSPSQRSDHGTHVAGTAIAIGNNAIGISGIAPKCKFMPIKVATDNDFMTITSVLDGILYAIYQGADVVNVSLGYTIHSLLNQPERVQKDFINSRLKAEERLWREVFRIATAKNVTIVVAAGNDDVLAGIDPLQRPDEVVVVAALDKNQNRFNKADFSNYGDYATISAPGVSIYSTVGSSGYEIMNGTSMAAPVVTGSIALMKSINPSITTKQVKCALVNTAMPVNDKVPGLIQLDKVLAVVKRGDFNNCNVEPSTGDVQLMLSWNNYNDIDLICKDPNGELISYKNKKVRSGGMLEIDMNVSYPDSNTPIENIYWPTNSAPHGTYDVYVKYFRKHATPIVTPYTVKVKHQDIEDTYSGELSRVGEEVKICSFTIGDTNTDNRRDHSRDDSLRREKERLEEALRQIEEELGRLN